MNKSNRIEYISLASVLSAIAVVYLHANGCFWTFSTSRYWFTANIIESVFYFAVPIFFMISGAMLIDYTKKYSTKKYFTKRIVKTVIPYLIWSLIGLAIQVFIFNSINAADVNLSYIIKGLLNGSLVGVYWFFIPLFCIYLVIPVFSSISDDKKKDIFVYISVITFILNIFIPFIISIFGIQFEFPISFELMGGYLFYTITGYLLHKYELPKKYRFIIYVLAVIGLLMHIFGTYYLSISAGELVKTYKGYMNVPCVMYSIGIFIFAKYDLVRLLKFNFILKTVQFLDFYTFGIYLLHWYLLRLIAISLNVNVNSIVYRLFAPLLVIMMAVIVINLMRRVPIVKNIVP